MPGAEKPPLYRLRIARGLYDQAGQRPGSHAEHILNIDDIDNRPSLTTVLSTAAFYGLGVDRARQVVEEVATVVDGWQDAAHRTGIASADINLTAGAFSAHVEFRLIVGRS